MNFDDYELKNYKGEVITPVKDSKHVIINVASECGYTDSGYKNLKEFLDVAKNVEVYLYPCNDFGGQEPGEVEDVVKLCDTYGVINRPNVHMMEKTVLNDSPLWHWLQYTNNGSTEEGYDLETKWNFFKYLVDEEGDMWGIAFSDERLTDEDIISWVNT